MSKTYDDIELDRAINEAWIRWTKLHGGSDTSVREFWRVIYGKLVGAMYSRNKLEAANSIRQLDIIETIV